MKPANLVVVPKVRAFSIVAVAEASVASVTFTGTYAIAFVPSSTFKKYVPVGKFGFWSEPPFKNTSLATKSKASVNSLSLEALIPFVQPLLDGLTYRKEFLLLKNPSLPY